MVGAASAQGLIASDDVVAIPPFEPPFFQVIEHQALRHLVFGPAQVGMDDAGYCRTLILDVVEQPPQHVGVFFKQGPQDLHPDAFRRVFRQLQQHLLKPIALQTTQEIDEFENQLFIGLFEKVFEGAGVGSGVSCDQFRQHLLNPRAGAGQQDRGERQRRGGMKEEKMLLEGLDSGGIDLFQAGPDGIKGRQRVRA